MTNRTDRGQRAGTTKESLTNRTEPQIIRRFIMLQMLGETLLALAITLKELDKLEERHRKAIHTVGYTQELRAYTMDAREDVLRLISELRTVQKGATNGCDSGAHYEKRP
jgi:hypothetical protein